MRLLGEAIPSPFLIIFCCKHPMETFPALIPMGDWCGSMGMPAEEPTR